MNASDLRALKFPLILLLIVLAVGATASYFVDQTLGAAKRELAQKQKQLRDARTRLHKSGDEKQVIVHYLRSYKNLERLGFAGEEQRINWLDALRLTNQQAQLFGVDYQISVRHPYPYAGELDPGQLALYQSLMKVNVKLLHEGDLVRFLGTLAKQGAGVFSVNECVLERIDTGRSIRYQANVRAECELAWITVKPAEGERKS